MVIFEFDLNFCIGLCFIFLVESNFEQGLLRNIKITVHFQIFHWRNFQDDLFRTNDKYLGWFALVKISWQKASFVLEKNVSISLSCEVSMQHYQNKFQSMQDGVLWYLKISLELDGVSKIFYLLLLNGLERGKVLRFFICYFWKNCAFSLSVCNFSSN